MIAVAAAVSVAGHYGPAHTGLIAEPVIAVGLVIAARRLGISWRELGLSRSTWARGAIYALVAIAVVAFIYLAAATIPITRDAFMDTRYQLPAGRALLTALVIIPLGTILFEEVMFRGVLPAIVRKSKGVIAAVSVSSVLFGLWHVLPSLAMGANMLVVRMVGEGMFATCIMVAAVVAFTGAAGWLLCEIRHRSGSIIATAGLHWATNGLGVLLSSAIWSIRLAT